MAQGTIASGTGAFIGIGAQTSWAGASQTRTKFLPVLSFGGGLEQDTQERNDLTTSASSRGFWKGGKRVKFSTSHLMDFEGHEMWLKRAFGACASAVYSSCRSNTFTLLNPKILGTLELCLDSALATPKTPSLVRPANQITAVEFEGNLFDPVKVTYEYLGINEDALAVASTPTFPADNLIIPTLSASTTVKVGNTAYNVIKWKLRIEDPMRESGYYIGNARTMSEPGREEKRKITGELTMEFDSTDAVTLYALYTGLTESTFQACYVGGTCVDPTPYTFTIDVWRIVPTGKTPEVGGPGIVEFTMPFTAMYDVTNSKDAVTLTLLNTVVSVA